MEKSGSWNCVLLLSLLSVISLVTFAAASDVLELTDDDFDVKVKQHKVILVEFYAPWCGHCKALAPKYDEAAAILKKNDPPAFLAKVDCIEGGKETCQKHGVSGYPTLKVFRDGEFASEYNAGREVGAIVKFMKSQVGPASKELKSTKDVEDFTTRDDVAIIGFFESDKEPFLKVADKYKDTYRFGHSTAKDVLNKYSQYKDNVVLFRPKHLQSKFEESEVVFKGKLESAALKEFITDNYHGVVGHKTRDNAQDFPEDIITAYYKVDYIKNVKGTNYWRNRILKVAMDFKDQFKFAIANKDEFTHELNEYGFDYVSGDKPVVTAKKGGVKYVLKDEFSIDAFKTYLDNLSAGKLEAYLKSEAVPEDNDKNPVKVAVAKNFDELVTNSNKDALVEFYAPWCGHCKKLTPIYDELGKEMEYEPDLNIVKMDATANDVPSGFEVHGFPTIYFVPKGGEPLKYQGERELKGFIKYLAKESTNELAGYDRSGNKRKVEL